MATVIPHKPATTTSTSWSWVHVGLAALAMVTTLPGRTHGLGLFTEPLLKSFELDRQDYGVINLWATLLGGLFCLPCGGLFDRFGARVVLVGTMVLLAASVLFLGLFAAGPATVFVGILLTRGFGQSALSVGSLSLIGRSAQVNTGLKMGVYSCLTSIGFIGAFMVLRDVIPRMPHDWRTPWNGLGVAVLVSAIVTALLIRNTALDVVNDETSAQEPSRTLADALTSRAFWAFAVGTSFYGLVVAGTSLFNESILAERGFDKAIFLNVTIIGIPFGLMANLLGGWLAMWVRLEYLFASALVGLALTLASFGFITEEWQVYTYASVLAVAGGYITVVFFTCWRKLYGPASLGRIQGAAQLLTVLFSAVGPLVFATMKAEYGAYQGLFPIFAVIALSLAVFTLTIRKPQDDRNPD